MVYFFIALACIGGCLTAIQGKINARLGQLLEHPLQASWISFLGGLATVTIVLAFLRPPLPAKATFAGIPWWTYIGGFLGAIFVTLIILLVPKIGLTRVLVPAIGGQLMASVVIDHFGLLYATPQPIDLSRSIGLGCLAIGVVLVTFK